MGIQETTFQVSDVELELAQRGLSKLTNRERQVLALICRGYSNKEAGKMLGISPRTIEVHRARVLQKFGARNSAQLMRLTAAMEAKPLKAQSQPKQPVDVMAVLLESLRTLNQLRVEAEKRYGVEEDEEVTRALQEAADAELGRQLVVMLRALTKG